MVWLLALAVGLVPRIASAEHILTLRSAPLAVYAEALQGFKAAYGRGPVGARKTIAPVRYTDLLLTELGEPALTAVRAQRPDLVVAIGQRAVESVADLTGVPLVVLMAARMPASLESRRDVGWVPVAIAPEQWVEAFARAMPGRRRVGVVYDPRRTGEWVERAQALGYLQQIDVTPVAVSGERGVAAALDQLRGEVEALWMIPDLTAVTPQTVPLWAAFSLEQEVPVFSFAEKYLTAGATAAFVLDPAAVGRRGAALAAAAAGLTPVAQQRDTAAQVVMRVNRSLAYRFFPDARPN